MARTPAKAKPQGSFEGLRIAVLLPCYNEEAAIARTIAGFRASLPGAQIFVYDNNSKDRTVEVAAAAGAITRSEKMQGKGNVVRRMFADVEADIYVMADGDATYDAAAAPEMVRKLLDEQLDMVVGARKSEVEEAYRRGHVLGNKVFTGLLSSLFGRSFSDIFSGYRIFSRRFAKSFPALSRGFETETEISVHALELAMPVGEVLTAYGARPEGSESQLSTYRDGWRLLNTILHLHRIERPVLLYGSFSLFLVALADGDTETVSLLLDRDPGLARSHATEGASRADAAPHFLAPIRHYVYVGDTALHIAAAAHAPGLITLLLALGAAPSALNRRG